MVGVWYGLKYIIIEKNFLLFIYELSLFSFWTEHKGAWYVAALIPLYLIYPLIFKWLDRGQEKLKIYSLILALMLFMIFLPMMNEHLYNHLSRIIIGLISFFIGTIIAKKIKNNASSSFINLFLFGIVLFIVKTLSPLKNISWFSDLAYGFLSISIIFIIVFIIKFFNKSVKRIFVKLGEISLESYLFNIF